MVSLWCGGVDGLGRAARVDLREVAFDVVLVARRHLLVTHHVLDDLLIVRVHLAVRRAVEPLLGRGEDGLALRGATGVLLAGHVLILRIAGLRGRIAVRVLRADAPLLTAGLVALAAGLLAA